MQNSTSPLVVEASKYRLLRERLLAVCPCADEETLRDTLEGINDLHEMIAAVIRSALVDEALATGLRSRLDDMKQRLGRLDERGAKKRQLALDAMNDVGLKKLEQPDFTATARTGSPSLVVVAENAIPPVYWCRSHRGLIDKVYSPSSNGEGTWPAPNLAIPIPY